MPPAPTVFISYSHKDEVWKDRLVTHLGVLEHQGLLQTWNDRNIGAGDEWLEEIRKGMDAAKVAVLLISAHSLTSRFILNTEVPRLLERRESEGMIVFPVICKDSLWQEIPWLAKLQARPRDGKALASFRGNSRDVELAKIAKEILEITRNGAPRPQPQSSADPSKLPILAALHQLPTPPADFTGRQEDLDFLRSRLSQGGTGAIFGLRGMGGVGKTSLALKLAEELKPRFSDAQLYLDLKGVDPHPLSPAQAMAHAIRAFHPEARLPESEADLAVLYRSVLEGKQVLLLMDNAASREQIEPLIPPSTCLLLVTSRFRFALSGLVDRDLDEMPEQDAKDLLLRIAPRIGDAADEIASLCGRLPLALRLAGSALAERPNLSPAEYARRFRAGKEKLEPVEASLRTSYDLLTEERRRLWRMLAVFPETFDAKASAAVWALEMDDAGGHLGELVRSSLIEWEETEERYRLHDLAREYGGRLLNAVEYGTAKGRHAAYFLVILQQADQFYRGGKSSTTLGLKLLDREWLNIQGGHKWAVANSARDLMADELCDRYPTEGAFILSLRLHPRDWIQWTEPGLEAARRRGNKYGESAHLGNLCFAFEALGNARRALELAERQLAIGRENGYRLVESKALGSIGGLIMQLGDYQQAINFHEQRIAIAREVRDHLGETTSLGLMGEAYGVLGDIPRAIELFEKQLELAREIGNRQKEGHALGNMGAYIGLSDPLKAIELHKQQLAIAQELGDRRGEGAALGSLGEAYAALGETQSAIKLYEQVLAITREIGDRRGEGQALGSLGNVYADLGESRHAIEFFEQHLTIAREIGDRRGEGTASWNLGVAFWKEGDLARAADLMQVRVDYLREISHPDAEKCSARVAALRAHIADAARD
jgi:tetratricopeptide (TPR) repeat protein